MPPRRWSKTVDQVTRIARRHRGRDRRRPRRCAPTRSPSSTATPARAYGIPDEQTIEAIHLAARTEGMLTDPVYEGKSMAGLIGMIRSGEIPPGSRVLYAHLGGQPALSAYAVGARPRLGSISADQQ